MRSRLVLAGLAGAVSLGALGPAFASNAHYGDHFRLVGSAPGANVALWIDLDRIERRGDTVSAWLLMVGEDRLDSETGKGASPADYKMIRASFDCAASTYRLVEGAYYTYEGRQVRNYEADAKLYRTNDATLMGASARYLCRNAPLQMDMTVDSLGEALRFSRKIHGRDLR